MLPGFVDSHTHRLSQRFKWGFETIGQASDEALSQGWTSLTELAVDQGTLSEFIEADEQGLLNIRVNCYLMVNSFEGESLGDWYQAYQPGQQLSPHVRVAGLKIFIDFNSGRTWLWGQDELNEFVQQRKEEGWQVTMKTIGIQSHKLALSAYEVALGSETNESYRFRVEHSLGATDDQIARMSEMGIIASIQPSFPGVIWHEQDICNLVDEQGQQNMFRWRDYLDAGIVSIASPYTQDGVNQELTDASHVSPMGLLYRSLTQVGLGGGQPESWMLEQSLALEEILPMLTINGAYATFLEGEIGSLAAGKLADLVVLNEDPLATPAEDLLNIDVLMSMVGGQVEWCASEFETQCSSVSVAPVQQPTGQQGISASAWLSTDPPEQAFDGNPDAIWNSGDDAEQWIQIDFGEARTITEIKLTIAQYPEGETIHQIWAGTSEQDLQLVYEFSRKTADGDTLEFHPPDPLAGIRVVRIITPTSPSWVAWRELEIE